jgi:hypothetical protein
MTKRGFIGNAGRPFGTVVALLCLLLTAALITLGDVAGDMIGATRPFDAIALGKVDQAHDLWGLLLASEIVRTNLGCLFAIAVWTLSKPIGPAGPGRTAALVVGLLGAVVFTVAARQGIQAAAWLSEPRLSGWGPAVATLDTIAYLLLAGWAVLLVREARAAGSLPAWVQLVGLATAGAVAAAAFVPAVAVVAASASLFWWGGIFLTLYKPEDRLAN